MRWLLLSLFGVFAGLTVLAYTVVLPETEARDGLVRAYLTAGDAGDLEAVDRLLSRFAAELDRAGLEVPDAWTALIEDTGEIDPAVIAAFASAFREVRGRPIESVPQLVWSTDANPAREVQMALFREWHLREYGEPIDIKTDPSNREITKAIVQSVAGAGPDIIEYYGPAEMRSLALAGIAYDLTDYARAHGFGVDTVFEGARSSIAMANDDGELRQFAYPCNVGYTVLLYHRDLFEEAGVEVPATGWTFDEFREAVADIVDAGPGSPEFGMMNLSAWDAALAAGGRFLTEDGAYSIYNSPESVRGLEAHQALVFGHGVMPTPGQAASMSAGAAGGFGGNRTVSAPGLFAQRTIATYVGGRWEYVTFAITNRDRVILPAIDRRLRDLDPADAEAALLASARRTLVRDVLIPLTEDQMAAIRRSLTPEDDRALLHVGATHVPTTSGEPFYSTAARGAVVNRALEREDPERLEYALRFLRFLGSEAYNEQINGAFDSIAGRIDASTDEDGVSGPPAALPGLGGFDSPVFADAMLNYAMGWQLSDYIGRNRMGIIAGEVIEDVEANQIGPEDAAIAIEEGINRQILANIARDRTLRDAWIAKTGVDPDRLRLGLREDGRPVTLREQIERLMREGDALATGGGDA